MQRKAVTSLIGRLRAWYGVVSHVETEVAMKMEILGTGCEVVNITDGATITDTVCSPCPRLSLRIRSDFPEKYQARMNW